MRLFPFGQDKTRGLSDGRLFALLHAVATVTSHSVWFQQSNRAVIFLAWPDAKSTCSIKFYSLQVHGAVSIWEYLYTVISIYDLDCIVLRRQTLVLIIYFVEFQSNISCFVENYFYFLPALRQ